MEPLAGKKAISDEFSYTLTNYYDGSTKTHQDRLLSILRIDEKHGFMWIFIVPIMRSVMIICIII